MALSPTSSRGASPVVSSVSATLTNAQIKALPGTDITILAAQGAATVIVPIYALFVSNFSVAYTGIDAANQFPGISFNLNGLAGFNNDSDVPATDLTALLTDTDPGDIWSLPGSPSLTVATASTSVVTGPRSLGLTGDKANVALKLQASNSINFTGGNAANTLAVTVLYTVLPV